MTFALPIVKFMSIDENSYLYYNYNELKVVNRSEQ